MLWLNNHAMFVNTNLCSIIANLFQRLALGVNGVMSQQFPTAHQALPGKGTLRLYKGRQLLQGWCVPYLEPHFGPFYCYLVCVIQSLYRLCRPLHFVELLEDAECILKGAPSHRWR